MPFQPTTTPATAGVKTGKNVELKKEVTEANNDWDARLMAEQ
jgi:hypothetical protein